MTDLTTCPACGLQYDPSDLANVVAHEHNTEFMIEKGKYMGERVPSNESKARFFSNYLFSPVICDATTKHSGTGKNCDLKEVPGIFDAINRNVDIDQFIGVTYTVPGGVEYYNCFDELCRNYQDYYKTGQAKLLLHSIKDITDEQAMRLAELAGLVNLRKVVMYTNGYSAFFTKAYSDQKHRLYVDLLLPQTDYLRSIGVTLDFYDTELDRVITVSEQIELGWVKIREK